MMTSIFQKLTNSVSSNTPSGSSGGASKKQQQETSSPQTTVEPSKYPLARSVVNELEAIFLDNEDVDDSQRPNYDDDDELKDQNNKTNTTTSNKSPILNKLNGIKFFVRCFSFQPETVKRF